MKNDFENCISVLDTVKGTVRVIRDILVEM